MNNSISGIRKRLIAGTRQGTKRGPTRRVIKRIAVFYSIRIKEMEAAFKED